MCTFDGLYDFDTYFEKADDYLSKTTITLNHIPIFPSGMWFSGVSASRNGAQQEFIEAMSRTIQYSFHFQIRLMTGMDDLCRGELLFYQGDIQKAEIYINLAMEPIKKEYRFDYIHRALLYTLRIAVIQGDRVKAEQSMKDIKDLLSEESYPIRFVNYDIAFSWYSCILRRPEMIPEWLKEGFTPYVHANYAENFANQVKARYRYLMKDYPDLLAYIHEMRQRESVLYGRVELLAMEACINYRLKDKERALTVLKEAYEAAYPNSLITPFMELGKDMRTLAAAAIQEPACGIPHQWLKNINQKASCYAKYQALIISEYRRENDGNISLSRRESEILADIYAGLPRSEIAAKYKLSANTVKLINNNIYKKLNANNIVDLIRIANEQKLI